MIRVFFMDYGTTGYLPLNSCRRLMEEFSKMSKKAIRGALYGIKPVANAYLWNLSMTEEFINAIRNRTHSIRIMEHHPYVSEPGLILQWCPAICSCYRRIFTSSCCSILMASLSTISSSYQAVLKLLSQPIRSRCVCLIRPFLW